MKTISRSLVDELIDFAPTDAARGLGFAESQADGTTALYNMLARNRCAYLADEVGMGKTYVALGVMSLMRYFNPRARMVVIAPRENIQRKWEKELRNFVRTNWKRTGNRVRSIAGGPVWEPVRCESLVELASEILENADRDFFLRMTSFSIRSKREDDRRRLRERLKNVVRWLPQASLSARTPDAFRDAFGCAVNAVIPPIDLLIVDEAHNLKHGFGPSASTRNRVLGLMCGRPFDDAADLHWYGLRPRNVLLLSATPFEEDYASLYRQLDLFGFGDVHLKGPDGRDKVPLRYLTSRDKGEDEKRAVVQRLMLRRVSGLRIAGQLHTKNMYRREWRLGGYREHDKPMVISDPRQRLVVGLIQKKVSEILQDTRFNNHFQIGMLSSFESFLETLAKAARKKRVDGGGGVDVDPVFDGDQDANNLERRGIDTSSVARVADSHRKVFGAALPHPKLDQTAESFSDAFHTGEKALIFVRRVATVRELAAKLDSAFDEWMRSYMGKLLPEMTDEIAELFDRYAAERTRSDELRVEINRVDAQEPGLEEKLRSRVELRDDDEGSTETFFSWFFRGKGPSRYLSGVSFIKNRMMRPSSAYSLFFQDDHVAWLLGRPDNIMMAIAAACRLESDRLAPRLRERAYRYFRLRSRRRDRFARLYVFESYQAAALSFLAELSTDVGDKAKVVLDERYPVIAASGAHLDVPDGFPWPHDALGVTSLFTELVKVPGLRERLWPEERQGPFRATFRRREQRRELLSALARLGRSSIDIYLLAVKRLGTLRAKARATVEDAEAVLVADYLALLQQQEAATEFGSFDELAAAAEAFDQILALNLEHVPSAALWELPTILGIALQKQTPVGRMAGGVNKRLVSQFRMPGFPFVLVTTDVLQEGEDLHTFCSRVVHYGITWTPSAMEQRTGRVDRIGSLAQRRLDGRAEIPSADEFIQVYYPHLPDTVEVLQVRRVLRRLNRFIELTHTRRDAKAANETRVNTKREMLEGLRHIAPITETLESAFPVDSAWLEGELSAGDVEHPTVDAEFEHLSELWEQFKARHSVREIVTNKVHTRAAEMTVDDDPVDHSESEAWRGVEQTFQMELRSQAAGDRTLLRCSSHVTMLDLEDDRQLDRLYDAQVALGYPKICVSRGGRSEEDVVSVEHDIVFHHRLTDFEELESTVLRTVRAARALKRVFEEEE